MNAMRTSFFSYWIAATKSGELVDLEAGNSLGILPRERVGLLEEEDAAYWFFSAFEVDLPE